MFRGLPLILNLNQINLVYSSHSVSVIFTSILLSRCICLWLCLPSSLCSSGVPTQIPYTFLPHACHVPKYHFISSVTESFKMMQVVPSVELVVIIQTVRYKSKLKLQSFVRLTLMYALCMNIFKICLPSSIWLMYVSHKTKYLKRYCQYINIRKKKAP
jgi:hypothetical protein